MKNTILALVAMAAVGAVITIGNADNIIQAFVQPFGATPHEAIDRPDNVTAVQIDWSFANFTGTNTVDFNFIDDCRLTFDSVLSNGTTVICKVTGHDSNATDGTHNVTDSFVVGTGQITVRHGVGGNIIVGANGHSQVDVPILCVEDMAARPPEGPFESQCDIQEIEDVKVIVIGEETTDVTLTPTVNCDSPNIIDFCIDGDGIATPGRGTFTATVGNVLSTWPSQGTPPEGIDLFNIPLGVWNNAAAGGSDIHLEDPAGACSTALRDAIHNNNADFQDCAVLDLDGSLVDGQPVDCDLEFGIAFTFCPPLVGPNSIKFIDTNGDGGYNNGEDIIQDVNGNGVFD